MKLKNLFLRNYILVFLITTVIAFILLIVLSVISANMEQSLIKNKYTALNMMKDNIQDIEYDKVIENNGGVQVINKDYEVVLTKGIDNFPKKKLKVSEFTVFLVQSQSIERKYSYSVAYNEKGKFWLIITFPTSMRIDFKVTQNKLYESYDSNKVYGILFSVFAAYLLLFTISTLIYTRLTANAITNPLQRLKRSTEQLRSGDYSIRANLALKNEIGELGKSFDEMADRIQKEITLREKSEQNRRQMTLDIAHDLKNPFAAIMGYAEYCLNHPTEDNEKYLNIIYQKSNRVNQLVNRLFELSKLESHEYKLNKQRCDFAEYLRIKCGDMIPALEVVAFEYNFEIPEEEILVDIDVKEMDRVFDNIFENSLRYNKAGTMISVKLIPMQDEIQIIIKDNGVGISKEYADIIFQPFVRADIDRNSETGGNGLGLAIVDKIIRLHGGKISLETDVGKGCSFIINLPKDK